MYFQITFSCIAFIALPAYKWPETCVDALVLSQIIPSRKDLITQGAAINHLTCMDSLVRFQRTFMFKALATLLALMRLFSRVVDALVCVQVTFLHKAFNTLLALIWLLTTVNALESYIIVVLYTALARILISQVISLNDRTGLYVRILMAVIDKVGAFFNSHTPYLHDFYF